MFEKFTDKAIIVMRFFQANRFFYLGVKQYQTSQLRAALQSWQTALKFYQEIGNRQGEASSLGNLGLAYQSLGESHKAINFHQQYLNISREIGDRLGIANSLGNLGISYYLLSEYKRSKK